MVGRGGGGGGGGVGSREAEGKRGGTRQAGGEAPLVTGVRRGVWSGGGRSGPPLVSRQQRRPH